MASKVAVANIALNHLGEKPISSLTDGTNAANILNTRFDSVRDAVLRAHPWNFAEGRAALGQLVGAPAFGYSYRYQLPTDCLYVRRMDDPDYVFKVEGRELLTDEGTANILYTRRIEDPNSWDSLFIEALGLRLAWACCEAITKSKGLKDSLLQAYKDFMREASFVDGQEGTPEASPGNPFVDARL